MKTELWNEYQAVVAVVSDYLDGLHHGNTTTLARAFHPRAHYACATDGTLNYLTMDQYFPIVDRRASPASRREPRRDNIESIEFAGPVTARARVTCSIGERRFIDLLTLIFVDGRWRIISKVFHYVSVDLGEDRPMS